MDGVLTNFEKQSAELCNVDSVIFRDKKKTEMSEMNTYCQRVLFNHCDYNDKFWDNMPAMSYARALYKKCQSSFGKDNVIILSNFIPPEEEQERFKDVERLKIQWFRKNIDDSLPEEQLVITQKNKGEFVRPDTNCYLIDDMISNIKKWEAAGGKGIHHKGNVIETFLAIENATKNNNILINNYMKYREK